MATTGPTARGVYLNPPGQTVIRNGIRVIIIAEDDKQGIPEAATMTTPGEPGPGCEKLSVLSAGWSDRAR